MLTLALLMLVILMIASGVVLYVAYPHRGEEVPVAPWLGDAIQRSVETVGDLLEAPAGARERKHVDH